MKKIQKISIIILTLIKLLNGQTGVLTGKQDSAVIEKH